MFAHVVSILGDGKPSPWVVQYENLGDSQNHNMVCFLTEKSGNIPQKLRVGGYYKLFENDSEFDMNTEVSYIQDSFDEGIECQTIQLPFETLTVNGSNLNPTIASYNKDDMITDHNCLVFIMNTSYKYVRSYIDDECAEIVSTFKAKKSIGCIIKLDAKTLVEKISSKKSSEYPILMVDTEKNGKFHHFRVFVCWNEDSSFTVKVSTSEIKKEEIIKKLIGINKNLEKKPTSRRFFRTSGGFITHTFITPVNVDTVYIDSLIDKYGVSDTLVSENIICHQVNIDEEGYIVEDKLFKKVQNNLIKNKTKAITLVNCKCKPSLFVTKPLYIFICDETENVNGRAGIRCIKTN